MATPRSLMVSCETALRTSLSTRPWVSWLRRPPWTSKSPGSKPTITPTAATSVPSRPPPRAGSRARSCLSKSATKSQYLT